MLKIAVIIGSDSDLPQCLDGLEYLQSCEEQKEIEVWGVHTLSQHRNTLNLQDVLKGYSKNKLVDALIIGAGWANHLTGCSDAFLRNIQRDKHIKVIGVAFSDPDNQKHTLAAELSITEVPGTQVIFNNNEGEKFIGSEGFLKACQFVESIKNENIKLSSPKKSKFRTLEEAINGAKSKIKETEVKK
ncbi:MAG: AIR carboxylase family protein [Patescibacteria group bacterium]